ncbi:hypothetical protein GDO78_006757 [Eleutherodactylus coqui]|uniref:Uncharacterized protein n=1 Tax=Eleutherodactylus coqui TaxID=57060 RepID=A0A8J6FEM3_ELECQ|nr:hypothetical protein GDO78_006757 [Eleutherodactylus coqui]
MSGNSFHSLYGHMPHVPLQLCGQRKVMRNQICRAAQLLSNITSLIYHPWRVQPLANKYQKAHLIPNPSHGITFYCKYPCPPLPLNSHSINYPSREWRQSVQEVTSGHPALFTARGMTLSGRLFPKFTNFSDYAAYSHPI